MAEDIPRNTSEAYKRYLDPIRNAVSCVTTVRLTNGQRDSLAILKPYSITLNEMDAVTLKGEHHLLFSAGQTVEIIRLDANDARGRFKVRTLSYLYSFSLLDGKELLNFHWHPSGKGPDNHEGPHLHIGASLISERLSLRPGTLHKAHIPTGRVSLEAVIRLAISEFGVSPLRDDWQSILQRTEDAFITHKTW